MAERKVCRLHTVCSFELNGRTGLSNILQTHGNRAFDAAVCPSSPDSRPERVAGSVSHASAPRSQDDGNCRFAGSTRGGTCHASRTRPRLFRSGPSRVVPADAHLQYRLAPAASMPSADPVRTNSVNAHCAHRADVRKRMPAAGRPWSVAACSKTLLACSAAVRTPASYCRFGFPGPPL